MKPASFDPARARRLDESTFGRPTFPRFLGARIFLYRHGRLLRFVFGVVLPVLAVGATLLALAGCATTSDVEKVRDDNIAATRATSDAVRDYLIAHPGDFLGAFAVQFRISIAAQEKQKDAAHKPDVVEIAKEVGSTILGIPTGGAVGGTIALAVLGILGKWVDGRAKRRDEEHDAADFVGPNGEKVGEPRIVAATLKVEAMKGA